MKAALLSICLVAGGCDIYLDPLYERYLDDGLMGLDDTIQDISISDAGGSVLAANGYRRAMVWENDGEWRHWLVEPVPQDYPAPIFISMSGGSVGVLFAKAKNKTSPFVVRVFNIESRQLEGEVTVQKYACGLEFLGNNMTFYTAEADAVSGPSNYRLAEYHRIEGESAFNLSLEVPLGIGPRTLAACPANQWLATCGEGTTQKLQIWDFSSVPATEVGTNTQKGTCDRLSFSRDCRYLAVHSNDSSSFVDVFDTSNLGGQPVSELFLDGYDNQGLSLALSPDASLLAVTGKFNCDDGTHCNLTRLYDRQKEKRIFEVKDYRDFMQAVVFENDGQRLATGGGRGIVKLWKVEKILQDLR